MVVIDRVHVEVVLLDEIVQLPHDPLDAEVAELEVELAGGVVNVVESHLLLWVLTHFFT